MTLEELYYADFEIMEPELVLQSWNDSHSYTGYQCSGRPYDGLMLITGDIRMEFSMIDGVTVTAAKNDLVYLPMGLRYTVRIEWEAAALPRIQDLLFNFILRDENGQSLSLSDIPLIVSRDGERFEKYFQALSAACHAPKRSMVCVNAAAYRLLRLSPAPSPQPTLSQLLSALRGCGLLSHSMFSSGTSFRNREGMAGAVRPNSMRCRALVRVSVSLARVMAT